MSKKTTLTVLSISMVASLITLNIIAFSGNVTEIEKLGLLLTAVACGGATGSLWFDRLNATSCLDEKLSVYLAKKWYVLSKNLIDYAMYVYKENDAKLLDNLKRDITELVSTHPKADNYSVVDVSLERTDSNWFNCSITFTRNNDKSVKQIFIPFRLHTDNYAKESMDALYSKLSVLL